MKRRIEEISLLEKYRILLKPDLDTTDIRLLNACGIGKATEIRVLCENYILQEGHQLLAHKKINTWAYMQLFGLKYEDFERYPQVSIWKKENT